MSKQEVPCSRRTPTFVVATAIGSPKLEVCESDGGLSGKNTGTDPVLFTFGSLRWPLGGRIIGVAHGPPAARSPTRAQKSDNEEESRPSRTSRARSCAGPSRCHSWIGVADRNGQLIPIHSPTL